MSDVRLEASPMSKAGIEAIAKRLRTMFSLDEPYLQVTSLLEEFLPAALGDKFTLTVKDKREMGNRHGYVDPATGELALRQDVYTGVCDGSGRDRFTACHELGHYFLHRGVLNRVSHALKIEVFRDPEWQANTFASTLLMPREHFSGLSSTKEVATEFGVSLEAAKVRVRMLGLTLP